MGSLKSACKYTSWTYRIALTPAVKPFKPFVQGAAARKGHLSSSNKYTCEARDLRGLARSSRQEPHALVMPKGSRMFCLGRARDAHCSNAHICEKVPSIAIKIMCKILVRCINHDKRSAAAPRTRSSLSWVPPLPSVPFVLLACTKARNTTAEKASHLHCCKGV